MIICVDNMYFYHQNFYKDKALKPCYQTTLQKEFEIRDTQPWENTYVCKLIDVDDKQLYDFNYRPLNIIPCKNAYLCNWKVEVKAERMHDVYI